jgi:hypothetical protein
MRSFLVFGRQGASEFYRGLCWDTNLRYHILYYHSEGVRGEWRRGGRYHCTILGHKRVRGRVRGGKEKGEE